MTKTNKITLIWRLPVPESCLDVPGLDAPLFLQAHPYVQNSLGPVVDKLTSGLGAVKARLLRDENVRVARHVLLAVIDAEAG